MTLSLPNLRQMGVINLTPNSFSDGNQNLDSHSINESLLYWNKAADCILDFGAESTAPLNEAVQAEEEWSRYERYLLPLLNSSELLNYSAISLDSYRPETIRRLMPKLQENYKGVIIWNDVSGLIDLETISVLEEYPKLHYILCHNWASRRSDVQKHMEFCRPLSNELFLEAMIDWFHFQLKKIPVPFHQRLWLDPCFGFAKNLEQNLFLFDSYEKFFQTFADYTHVIGISRKSFMRHSLFLEHPESRSLAREALNLKLDELQKIWLRNLCQRVPASSLIIRTHRSL